MYKALTACMLTGLRRGNRVLCEDVNKRAQAPFREFVVQQLNDSKLLTEAKIPHDFTELKMTYSNMETDAVIPGGLVVLLSGGMDSLLMLFHAIVQYRFPRVTALFIDYGAPYNEAESIAQEQISEWFKRSRNHPIFKNVMFSVQFVTHKIPDIELNAKDFGDGYIIPLRNALLASIAVMYGDRIWLAAHWRKDDNPAGACDKSVAFFSRLSELLSLNFDRPVEVWSPFLHMRKEQVLQGLLNAQSSLAEPFKYCVSCYNPFSYVDGERTKMCGKCYSCWKSAKAYRACNVMDIFQDRYRVNPFGSDSVKLYEQREIDKGRL